MATDYKSPINYTADNWSVQSQYTDTISTGKSLTVPTLDWEEDYALKEQSPGYALYQNITALSMGVPESVQIKQSLVSDVYAGSNVPSAYRFSMKEGTKLNISVKETVKAINSVSGDTIMFPTTASLTLTLPTASFVDTAVLGHMLGRIIGACFNSDSSDVDRLVEIARGKVTIG